MGYVFEIDDLNLLNNRLWASTAVVNHDIVWFDIWKQ